MTTTTHTQKHNYSLVLCCCCSSIPNRWSPLLKILYSLLLFLFLFLFLYLIKFNPWSPHTTSSRLVFDCSSFSTQFLFIMPAPPFAQQAFKSAAKNVKAFSGRATGFNLRYTSPASTVGLARRWASTHSKYPFSNIPRPKRNILYYNPMGTIKRRLSQLPSAATKPMSFVKRTTSFTFQGIRYRLSTNLRRTPLNNNNFFVRGYGSLSSSSNTGNKHEGNKARKIFLKFWAIPTVTTVRWWRRRADWQARSALEGCCLQYSSLEGAFPLVG